MTDDRFIGPMTILSTLVGDSRAGNQSIRMLTRETPPGIQLREVLYRLKMILKHERRNWEANCRLSYELEKGIRLLLETLEATLIAKQLAVRAFFIACCRRFEHFRPRIDHIVTAALALGETGFTQEDWETFWVRIYNSFKISSKTRPPGYEPLSEGS